MNKYIIIPGCSDLNRGDQALAWETKRFAQEAGFDGEFYLTSERNEPILQSQKKGIKIVLPILEHPSRKFKNKENIQYTRSLKLKWGMVSILDLVWSFFLLLKLTRWIVKFFLPKAKKEVLNLFIESKAVFMKGGGLLQTYGGLASTYSMYFWVYPILLAHALKKPVYILPNSFGPFEGPLVKRIALKALSKCKLVTSRETLSQDMVKEQLGLDIQNYPDLAFTLPSNRLDQEAFFRRYNIPRDRKCVAITMRPYRFPNNENPKQAYTFFKTQMAIFIQWLYLQGFMPLVIEHTLAINAHENDAACIQEVCEKIEPKMYRYISDSNYDCQDMKCIYGYCDYIVGTRFHSMIFSFGNLVPGIAISYTGNKSKGIMHDMDLDAYVVDIEDVRATTLQKKFIQLLENEEEIVEKIRLYVEFAKNERQKLIEQCRK